LRQREQTERKRGPAPLNQGEEEKKEGKTERKRDLKPYLIDEREGKERGGVYPVK